MILVYIILTLLIHETGHVLAILLTGGRVTGFVVDRRGFGLKWRGDGNLQKQAAVSLSGPGLNLLLAGVFLAAGLNTLALGGVVFGGMNLFLPIDGADGWKAWKLFKEVRVCHSRMR